MFHLKTHGYQNIILSGNNDDKLVYRNPLAQMEEEKREHDLKMKKMESEMEQVCIIR